MHFYIYLRYTSGHNLGTVPEDTDVGDIYAALCAARARGHRTRYALRRRGGCHLPAAQIRRSHRRMRNVVAGPACGRLRLLSQQLRGHRCGANPAGAPAHIPLHIRNPEAAEDARIAAELDEQGWVALPGFHTAQTCADLRDQLDRIVPMQLPGALDVVLGVNEIRHPIPEHRSGLMAALAAHPRTLRLAQSLLRCSRRELRLREPWVVKSLSGDIHSNVLEN
jgi:hypothetical protein